MNKKNIRWGFIGCGSVTEVKSGPPYKLIEGFKIQAVMRRDLELAKDYAQRHDIATYYSDADALINDPKVDAIYIATPPDTHEYYALKVAAAGKPCCIEKPLSPSYAESLNIVETFKIKNIPLFVAYYRRSLPRFLKVKTWLQNNYIGKIRHISSHLSKSASDLDLSENYNWRTDTEIAPGGYFDDLASHGLDLFAFLLGDFKDVQGISLNQQNIYTAKDAVTASWLHKSGITGSGVWNFGCYENLDKVTIYGSKGTIEFSVFHENPIVLKSDTKNESLFIENPKYIQWYHVENIQKFMLENKQEHPSTGLTALHTSWVMDKILQNI